MYHGKALMAVWAGYFVWIASRRKPKQVKNVKAAGAGSKSKDKTDNPGLSKLLKLLTPHVFSHHGAYLAAYVAVLAYRINITVKIADIGGLLGSYMGARKWNLMFSTQGVFGLW
jgi:hypothetical protein